ncbi:hypothetical protein PFTANZ_01818 [Plasmodium falciparum Tanzania (2000708)]|uniref:Uncharacterized protein n=2 Tax=Plasmodium falciparum TaxID=5833 RepID=A0A024WA90_PLAFA|nr:hypothetical protein PFTANZ_01818 [Plasmodium falciparum Tanzania (2000708)]ETW43727.1 hypothetical protein PFNF135_01851 [Plasmodium falciparum NF135/5.C10]
MPSEFYVVFIKYSLNYIHFHVYIYFQYPYTHKSPSHSEDAAFVFHQVVILNIHLTLKNLLNYENNITFFLYI